VQISRSILSDVRQVADLGAINGVQYWGYKWA
jgi:hypothetical protein